jgi:hypothetical protein
MNVLGFFAGLTLGIVTGLYLDPSLLAVVALGGAAVVVGAWL